MIDEASDVQVIAVVCGFRVSKGSVFYYIQPKSKQRTNDWMYVERFTFHDASISDTYTPEEEATIIEFITAHYNLSQ